ncbi:hypothetical protein ThvES_00017170 [Thiovulum sp. ES]|nr:hypothetical protein ThvES_00017170 [Thiovulum sp. ES]
MKGFLFNSIFLTAIFFAGCSSQSSIPERENNETLENSETGENIENDEIDNVDNLEDNKSYQTIEIPSCDTMITVNSGDKIVKKSENSEVKIQHLVNGTKYICLKSGEGEIQRVNFE